MRKGFALLTVTLLVPLFTIGVRAQDDQARAQTGDQAQALASDNNVKTPEGTVPVFRILVIGRTVKAINYRNRESTQIGFEGTSLLAGVEGKATVVSKQGATRIHAEFKHLTPASSQFGPPYLTYVLWAITPDGRPSNLGEIEPNHSGNATVDLATNFQAFGLIVTAEPYFAVIRPSDMVVAQNYVLPQTTGTIEQVDAKFELLKRGQYTRTVDNSRLTPFEIKGEVPLDIYEAENAIRIAKWAGAGVNSADTLAKAQTDLQNAQDMQTSRGDKRSIITDAREATQIAEDARIISLNKEEDQRQAELKTNAEQAHAQAEQAQAQAAAAQAQAQQAQSQAEADAKAKAEALQAQQQAQQEAQQAGQAAENAQQQAAQAQQQAAEMRAKLLRQLNAILQTQDTQRGLIVHMSDVLFATGRYELKPDAKLALAKLAGVIATYPGLKLEVDGYTDSTGNDETNQTLSDKRAEAVRIFLVSQGVSPDSITAQGFGDANPIASNDTAQGRQLNRRVDMIVSGTVIGTEITPSTKALASSSSGLR
ncbi:MAG TPA: OmpA family protein [Terriglobia bacterium]|nr:OmpA family protein [Terriglobia bacterium]